MFGLNRTDRIRTPRSAVSPVGRATPVGERRQVEWRELDEDERRAAGEAFRDAHPIYSRMILGAGR